ncbi:MAG: hypothetical protein J6B74_02215, partial [Ruminococcus sp.]|nr:hypothetical protein [Ruminococcus sp.]
MSSKLVSTHKNNMCNVGQMSSISKFYMKLPEEVIEFALSQLNRDVKRKLKKEKRTEGKIIMALNMSASTFADAVYNYQKSSMIFSENTEYEKILASYNAENCIINTVLILKKCCDGTFGQKITSDFIKSEEFKKTVSVNYDNYEEETSEENEEVSEEVHEEIEEKIEDEKNDNNESEPVKVQEIPEVHETAVSPTVASELTVSTIKNEIYEKKKKKSTVYYIGNIETRGTFYNFKPQYTLEDSTSGKKLVEMYQIPEKFPKFGSINLSYVGNRRSQEVLDNLDLNLIY